MVILINITINEEYKYSNYDYLIDVLKLGLKRLKVDNVTFEITFCDDNFIRQINKEYRQIDKVTDVISFAFEDNGQIMYNSERLLGEIYISIPTMIRQAKEYGHSEKRELSFLALHGMLHLLGYDHMEKEEEKIMFNLQELILNDANIPK